MPLITRFLLISIEIKNLFQRNEKKVVNQND